MNRKDFVSDLSGRVVDLPQGYCAFVPAPLPPAITYDAQLVRLLSRADAALSELSGLGRILPNPHLLIAPWVRREAVLSSRIEGTRASLSDLLIDELAEKRSADQDLLEVRNYVAALEYGIRRLESLPLSLRLTRELHERLRTGVRGDKATPGEFRKSQNWIGPAGSTPVTAAYVPPPVNELPACLDNWEKFLHQRDTMPDLVQCALMHEQLEAIHPFLDGNGRVGRLLITLFLMERKRLSQPLLYLSDYIDAHRQDYYELLYLSDYIDAHRQDYYDLLQRVRTHADWIGWIRFFITGVTEIAQQASERSSKLLDLREQYRERVRDKPRAAALIDELFTNPYITVAKAQAVLKVSNPTARAAVELLVERKIVAPLNGNRWRRMYVSRPVLEAIER